VEVASRNLQQSEKPTLRFLQTARSSFIELQLCWLCEKQLTHSDWLHQAETGAGWGKKAWPVSKPGRLRKSGGAGPSSRPDHFMAMR